MSAPSSPAQTNLCVGSGSDGDDGAELFGDLMAWLPTAGAAVHEQPHRRQVCG